MTDDRSATCRAYVIGAHARALRARVLVAFGIALVAAILVPPLLRSLLFLIPPGSPQTVDLIRELLDASGFGVVYLVTLWLAIGPRRLAAMEILAWGSRYATAGYSAVTGIRDPADAAAASEWLRTHPAPADEEPESRYWRAYAHLVAGDLGGARSLLPGLAGIEGYGYAVASLKAQIDLAEGIEPDLGAVAAAAERWPDPLGRAVAMANLGALRGQRAFVCGADEIDAVLTVRSGVGGRASRFFLVRAWLPIVGLTAGALVLGRLLGTS